MNTKDENLGAAFILLLLYPLLMSLLQWAGLINVGIIAIIWPFILLTSIAVIIASGWVLLFWVIFPICLICSKLKRPTK